MNGPGSLRGDKPIHGFWSVTADPAILDAAASVGPDFVSVDTQHGIDIGRLDSSLFTALANYGVPGLVRVPSIEASHIGRALDLGATGVIVPLVETAGQTEAAVAATRYAPRGSRSFGMQTRRVGPFDEQPLVIIQVETARAVDEIDDIAGVEGVDGLYIGPADLGLALGGDPAPDVDQVFDGTHPSSERLASAFDAVIAASRRAGVLAGLHCGSGASAARAVARGFGLTSVAADTGLIAAGLERELEAARSGL